jgi:hypothetical protein
MMVFADRNMWLYWNKNKWLCFTDTYLVVLNVFRYSLTDIASEIEYCIADRYVGRSLTWFFPTSNTAIWLKNNQL